MSRFGRFELQRGSRRLLRDGVPLPLRERAIEVLMALLEQPGQVVTKRALCERGWPATADADNNLQVEISALRRLLGAEAIVTVPGRGYQFAAPLSEPKATLIGRDGDLANLQALLQPGSLVTVVGEAGIGKTLLAETVLRRWPGPVCRRAVDEMGSEGAAIDTAMQQREGLLLLDGCDGAVPAVATLASRLAERCPALAVLATSREVLRAPGERVWRIGGLSLAAPPGVEGDAVRLLRREGMADAPPALVLDICRRLEGHPLAIVLAARQGRALGAAALLERLDERLAWPAERGCVRTLLDDSVERLSTSERALFSALGGLPASFGLDDLPLLDAWERIELLGRLVDKSLVQVEPGPAGEPPRYRLSSTTRLYVRARWAPQA